MGLNGFEGFTVIYITLRMALTTYLILNYGDLFYFNLMADKKYGTEVNH